MQLSKTQRRLRLALIILAAGAGFAAAEASTLAPLASKKSRNCPEPDLVATAAMGCATASR